MTDARSDYISVGGNRNPAAADWDVVTGLLAFGADNNVALWSPTEKSNHGITALLKGHTAPVNAVKFFTAPGTGDRVIISASADKSIRIWRRGPAGDAEHFESAGWPALHEASINCIAELSSGHIFVTGAADGTVKIWKVVTSTEPTVGLAVNQHQSIVLSPKFFPLAVAITDLVPLQPPLWQDSFEAVLAVAGTKSSIQIFVAKGQSTEENYFELVANLTGHEAWVRSLAITYERPDDENSDLIIASASQDKYIRLWRIHSGQDLPSSSRALNDPSLGLLAKASLSNKAHRFSTASRHFSLTFEALLLGHEDWIYTASWRRFDDRLQLLSASADNSLAVWQADDVSGIWTCVARLGEISAQKGSTSATGSTGGFWIGLWSPDASAVVSLGRTGAWRLWQRESNSSNGIWTQRPAVTGHTREVNGITWSRDGSYLLSTGNDQTTRLHAEWVSNGSKSWHEFSRPQIHGYDLNCIDTITNSQFISGADEKLLRVFDEPEGVADVLDRLCGIDRPSKGALPDAANIPVLGLSNKAIAAPSGEEEETSIEGADSNGYRTSATLKEPPLEDHLARHMLWPEREKLYGHGYEINIVAANHSGTLVATACRASSIDHAVIRLYDTKEWREVKPVLKAHTLTVTGMQFSPDDRYLLSVGRDRQYCLWKQNVDSSAEYMLAHSDPKAHGRMILAVSWAPSVAGVHFATGGRDKSIKLWRVDDDAVFCSHTIATAAPVTALAYLHDLVNDHLVLAYGLETGCVEICQVKLNGTEPPTVNTLPPITLLQQSKSVLQLAWRPSREEQTNGHASKTADGSRQLAVSCADGSLHIASIKLS